MKGIGALALGVILAGTWGTAVRPADPSGAGPVAATLDIKVAVKSDAGCGPFQDSLPILVTAPDMQPGAVTPTTVVCLRNQGGARGSASLSMIEVVAQDDACTGSESQVDSSCGNGLVGELQNALVQEYVLLKKCNDKAAEFAQVSLAGLTDTPLQIGLIGRNDTRCVALRLRYADGAYAEAAQTDSVSWRYAFQLTS